ncbi:hypothetical protein D3C72_1369300 [compost metagenome]
MQLAHPGDNRLAGFFVRVQAERRIFCRQALQRDPHFLLIGLGFRLNRQRNHRVRELHTLQGDQVIRIAQGIARRDIFQPHAGGDITRTQFIDLMTVVGMHLHNTPDTLFLPFHRVVHRIAFSQHAGIDTDKGQLADVRVGHQLERQR